MVPNINNDIDESLVQIEKAIRTIKKKNKFINDFFRRKINSLKKDFNLQAKDEHFIQNYMNQCLKKNPNFNVIIDQLESMKADLKSCQDLFDMTKNPSPRIK
jgi:hypothetical protein